MVRCVDLFTSPQGEVGPTFSEQQVKQSSGQRNKDSLREETHFVWNVVLDMVIQLALGGLS